LLPNATETKLSMTMNARELFHFFSLRLCKRAQWEIRNMTSLIYMILNRDFPILFNDEFCGPDCVIASCREVKPCGKPYDKTNFINELTESINASKVYDS
jgi:thymidylate synthase (FAD)